MRGAVTMGRLFCIGTMVATAGVVLAAEIAPLGEVRLLATGFEFTEGPAVDGAGNLFFSDIKTEKLHRVSPDGRVTTWLGESLRTNGLYFHPDGRLFACQTGSNKAAGARPQVVAYEVKTKDFKVLADGCAGVPFTRVNDLVIDSSGGVYFSDIGEPKRQPESSGVFYRSPDGAVTQMVSDVLRCNGVLLSPDEKTLYVLPSGQPELLAYPVEEPGKIGRGRVLGKLVQAEGGEPGGGDGLTVDVEGNLYLTRPAANCVQVMSAAGETLGTIPFPEGPANCCFGGPENRTLYVTARTSVYAVEMPVPGHRLGAPSAVIEEDFGGGFDASRFTTRIPNKNTEVRDGVLWTRGSSGGKYPPMVYLPVSGKDMEISFRYRHLGKGGMLWFFVDGDDGYGSIDHMLRVKLLRDGVQLQVDAHSLDENHPMRQNSGRPADAVSGAYRLNEFLPKEPVDLSVNAWREVKIAFRGETARMSVDGDRWQTSLTRANFDAAKRKLLWMQNGGTAGIEIDDIRVGPSL